MAMANQRLSVAKKKERNRRAVVSNQCPKRVSAPPPFPPAALALIQAWYVMHGVGLLLFPISCNL